MMPFYFGTPERRLFGVYDPPNKNVASAHAVVLCHPTGDEHIHAYRTMRQLAHKLSNAGMHVLRFDYYGTGDSSGETGDANMSGSCADIKTAVAELKDMSHALRISLIGMRLGANMAARVAVDEPSEIAGVTLWEPLTTARDIPSDPQSCNDFRPFDLTALAGDLPARTLVVLTAPQSQSDSFKDIAVTRFEGVSPWLAERIETGTIPTDAIQRIVEWVAQ